MAILIDENTQIVVQGITGREGRLRTDVMLKYGSRVVAGVTPGRGGANVAGVPVYDSVAEAVAHHPGINAGLVLVPAAACKGAVFEAIQAGLQVVCLLPERVPQHDALAIVQLARDKGCTVIGPNSPGLISPGKCQLGGIGGRLEMVRTAFTEGPVGVISRSGGNTMTLAYYLTRLGIGQSTAVGVGGDAFIGTSWGELLRLFQADRQTRAVVAYDMDAAANEVVAFHRRRLARALLAAGLEVYVAEWDPARKGLDDALAARCRVRVRRARGR
jgi:succinyl-CoA synthetase alpha subunit